MTPKINQQLSQWLGADISQQKNSVKTNTTPVRKRHWVLGSLVIISGSWITHTTTANIVEQPVSQAMFVDLDQLEIESNSKTNALTHAAGAISANQDAISQQKAFMPQSHAVDEIEKLRTDTYTIKRGDFLGSILDRKGFPPSLPHSLSKHPIAKQLVSLKVGNNLEFKFNDSDELRQMHYPVTDLKKLVVSFEDEKLLDAVIEDMPYTLKEHTASNQISSSLYEAALDAGLSNNLIMEMVRIFGWDIDFVLDIRAGDTFHVIYNTYEMNGNVLSDGNILAAEFTTQGQTYRAIRYEDKEGIASYYAPNGESMLGTFLRSPVEFSRISSRFGNRKHPILKTWRAHKGVDYAASRGTPIRSTADGKVISAGNKGGYGKTVVIRHAGRFSTLYAHMTGFAKNIRSGSRVKQGQTIGYVGSTGLATGPHLHYEFRLDGIHRNPLSFKTPKASSIAKTERAAFDLQSSQWLAKLENVEKAYVLAKTTRKNI